MLAILLFHLAAVSPTYRAESLRVEVRFAKAARDVALTGRAYVAFARKERPSPVEQTGSTGVPLFGVDVSELAPGQPAVIDATAFGHPIESLADLPSGEYFAEGFFNVYTKYARADGKTIWAHGDRWEGQNWKRSPGNLFSKPLKVTIDPKKGGVIAIECTEVLPPIEIPKDTAEVKHVLLESALLSKFWGRKVELAATVLLPKGFEAHPDARYPVVYEQDHFSLRAPGGRGGGFERYWNADDSPRFLLVTFQHPTPFYDDSYAVNSDNNGPYGDAIVNELIPEIEKRFRAIGASWSRMLTGGSTGGWESLALQIFHPDFFNGCWALCPDSLDFRAHQIVNVYKDDNAYFVEKEFTRVERPDTRQVDGNITEMMKDENRYELVVGEKSRSGGQWDGWEAVFSPCGEDGYPMRIWDKKTGKIDHAVAEKWKERYDLRAHAEKNWKTIGPSLRGKLHVYVGEDDTYYLENGVKFMETFLKKTDPPYEGTVQYGPNAPHGYGPELTVVLRAMAERIEKSAPAGADPKSWRY
jgi:enterochelin esterase-like enzyme